MNIGQKIRDARTKRGMTQRELAGSDFTRELISQIESGRCQPSLKTLTILAQRLGQTIQDFIPPSDSANHIDVRALLSVVDQCLQANLVDAAFLCAKEALRACATETDELTIAQAGFYLGRSHLALREWIPACGDIALFWIHQCEFDKAKAMYEEALDLLGDDDAAVIRGHLYRGLGYLAHIQERSERARELYEMSMDFFRLADATEDIANTRTIMAGSHWLNLLLR